MQRRIVRFLLIFGIIYATLFGGEVEHNPPFRIAHQVIAAVILGGWLIVLLRQKRPFPATPFDAPLLAAGVFWMIAALFSRDPRTSLEYTWPIWVHILFFYLFVDLMRRSVTMQRWIMEGVFMTAALVILITAFEMVTWYFGLGILPQFAQSWPELFGFTIPPQIHEASMGLNYNNPTAAYCLIVIPLALAGSLTMPQRDLKWALRGIVGSLLLVALATQSRGGLIGLVMLIGMITLLWLLRPETRARFPAILQLVLAPRVLLPVAFVVATVGVGVGFWLFAVDPAHPSGADASRVDLWYSAVEMFADHPIIGVGPRQFASNRLWYGHAATSYSNLPLQHAHSLYFNWLAEGGTLGLVIGFWLAVRFGRVWWRMWCAADAIRRRRLEGVLAGLIAFATHNLVDTFLQTQFMTLMVIVAAYTVAGGSPYDAHQPSPVNEPTAAPRFRRRMVGGVLVALLIVQIVFVPLHRAVWAHQQTLDILGDRERDTVADLQTALDHNRMAQRFDPWHTLYVLQEATIRGRLAAHDPATYLADAISTYEDALDQHDAWAQGWFNLSALYAEAGQYDDAIRAVQTAIQFDPIPARYYVLLGDYYLAVGDETAAYAAFSQALRKMPALVSSDMWLEPTRAAMLQTIRTEADGTGFGFDLALYSGDFATAIAMARSPGDVPGLRARHDALWVSDDAAPCPWCYIAQRTTDEPEVREYMVWAEHLLLDDTLTAPDDLAAGLTAEKAARAALFLDESGAGWSWYVLARLGLRGDLAASDDQIDEWLGRSVNLPGNYNFRFSTTVYGLNANLDILPQARTPRISALVYEPWLLLAERHEARAEWDEARLIYDLLLDFAPYDQVLQTRLAALPDEVHYAPD
ncbi:MAG: O-antigen ligase family protein [Anaerolineae bacterium]|nr:O-antigen ligase family protein [Anaerolineae bacterium]